MTCIIYNELKALPPWIQQKYICKPGECAETMTHVREIQYKGECVKRYQFGCREHVDG